MSPFILLVAFLAMVAQDFIGATLAIAEARGRAVIAGLLGMAQDLTTLLTIGIGVNTAIDHGWSATSVIVIGTLMGASFIGKAAGTRYGARNIEPE